jgi:hypothetical protein
MHHDMVHRVVGRVALRVEGDPQVVGAEPVLALLDQEVGAVGGGQDDVGVDQCPAAEVHPFSVDVQLEHADVGVHVGRVGGPADYRPGRAGDQHDAQRCRHQRRGPAYQSHVPSFWRTSCLRNVAGRRTLRPVDAAGASGVADGA